MLKIFEQPSDEVVYIDLMPGPYVGQIALVTCDANGECIEPILYISEVKKFESEPPSDARFRVTLVMNKNDVEMV